MGINVHAGFIMTVIFLPYDQGYLWPYLMMPCPVTDESTLPTAMALCS